MNHSMSKVNVVLVVVLGVVVGHEDVNVEAHQVDLAHTDSFSRVPITVQQLEHEHGLCLHIYDS